MKRLAAVLALAGVLTGCRPGREPGATDGLAPPPPPMALKRADSLYGAGEFAAARDLWQAALTLARSRNDSVASALLLTSLGLAARNLGDYDESRRAGEEALALKVRLDLRNELFRSYNALGLLAWNEGRLDDAATLFGQASAAAAAVQDSVGIAKAAANMAQVHTDRGELGLARKGFAQLREVSRNVGDTVLLGRALLNLAMVDTRLGDPLGALASVEEARALARISGDAEAEENALGQLATAYEELGEPQRAFAAIDSALLLAQSHGLKRQVAEDLKLLGDFYATAGDHRRALDYYGRAQTVTMELGLREDAGNVLRNEAGSFRALGHPDTAWARARRALEIHQAGGFRMAELDDHLLLAELATDRNDQRRAAQALADASRAAGRIGTPLAQAQSALGAARIQDRTGRPTAVLATLDSIGSGLARLGGVDQWEPDALRARAYFRLGRADDAEVAGRRAVASIERVRAGYQSGTLRTAFLSERAQVYADLVVVLLSRGRTEDAFRVADAARGRALLEHLGAARRQMERSTGSTADLYRAELLLRRIDELTRQLRTLGGEPPAERGAGSVATTRSLEERLDAARSEYEALIARAAGEESGSAALLGASNPDAAQVRRSLGTDELLVEYLVTPDRLHLFVLRSESTTHVSRVISAEQLASRVRLARELTAQPDSTGTANSVLQELYRSLIAPLVDLGPFPGVRHLIIVPHGTLAYLPFAALLDERGEPLVSRYSLLMLPSASALPALRLRTTEPPGGDRWRGSVALAPLPDELPASRIEVEDVRRIVGGRSLIGRTATEAAFRSALETAPIVHVATHGIMNSGNPMFTRLELAPGGSNTPEDDGRFEVHELLGLRIAADLVYLSGCETGKGSAWLNDFERGEDYVTLAQAFLFGGARNVVATLWRVADPGAAAFARQFYEAFGAGDPVEALAAAQRAMLRDRRYRAPYYWAAYQVSGAGALQAGPAEVTAGRALPRAQ